MKARFLCRALKARYRNEKAEIRVALSTLKQGDIAVDVGANKGAYLYWLRKAVGLEGTVFAYEPQHRLAEYLKRVCVALCWDNVDVRECALSASTGTATLTVPGSGDSPGATLESRKFEPGSAQSYSCAIDTLDQQLQGTARLNFLKVDVEGHELQVFRGGVRTLSRHRPVILFECERRHLKDHSMEDVFRFLQNLGYEGSFFCRGKIRPLDEFAPEEHQRSNSERFWDAPDYCNNFLFRHRT